MATPLLEGARGKVLRACEHLHQLDSEIQAMLDKGFYRATREADSETGEETIRIKKGTRELPLVRWGGIIGDVVHNLRSALDHVVWNLVKHDKYDGGYVGGWTEFPIFNDRNKYFAVEKKNRPKRGSGPHKIWGVGPKGQTVIKELQPFEIGYGPPTDIPAFWVIHYLDIVDKHREIILGKPIIREFSATGDMLILEHHTPGETLEDDTVLVRFIPSRPSTFAGLIHVPRPGGVFYPPPKSRVHMHFHWRFDIAFAEDEPTYGGLVIDTLGQCLSRVTNALNRFDPLFT